MDDITRARCALAEKDLWEYCRLKAPDFYNEAHGFLEGLCEEIQDFLSSSDRVLIINMPPRHGKSRTAGLATQWILGRDPSAKVMTGSYNEDLSTTFSQTVRDSIGEVKADPDKIVYSDIFPGVHIKRGDGAAKRWSLEGHHANYLATSPGGTATGFGATVMIIDDLIKNAQEANNAHVRDNHWAWFTDTMLSRLEKGGKIIIIMTRWHSEDLAGKAIKLFKERGWAVRTYIRQALQPDGSMLCEAVLDRKGYEELSRIISPEIVSANYQQIPIDLKGRLYSGFKTYREPPEFIKRWNYTDTADEGADYLCSFCWGETRQHEAYILDVLYTKAPMEETEPATAKILAENGIHHARIESNNGGRGFARSVRREMEEKLHTNGCVIKWFHQSKNKEARILTGATWALEHIYFPEGWENRWPELYDALMRYQREGKNEHDDAPDALTGIVETMQRPGGVGILK